NLAAGLAVAPLPLPARFETTAETAPATPGLLAEGWAQPEARGTWTDGHVARLALPGRVESALCILHGLPFVPPGHRGQNLRLSVAGRILARLRMTRSGPLVVALSGLRLTHLT